MKHWLLNRSSLKLLWSSPGVTKVQSLSKPSWMLSMRGDDQVEQCWNMGGSDIKRKRRESETRVDFSVEVYVHLIGNGEASPQRKCNIQNSKFSPLDFLRRYFDWFVMDMFLLHAAALCAAFGNSWHVMIHNSPKVFEVMRRLNWEWEAKSKVQKWVRICLLRCLQNSMSMVSCSSKFRHLKV